ncbi:hypothetical protein [Antrihabitans sp. YC2-6]|uniref:hypothetical protein n=1 Tax=Antrihabitans sp. YC2-6 TaxID=2799498 RepID=UPI0018F57B59|nr:hypothetical protein [Antrihabitans sp. YC2-6]MBJ8345511.1 hypothetical protein [Antrihabitans sp. YC2-6]
MTTNLRRRYGWIFLPVLIASVVAACAQDNDDTAASASNSGSTQTQPCAIPSDTGEGVSVYTTNGVTVAVIVAPDPNANAGAFEFTPDQVVYGRLVLQPNDPNATLTGTVTYRWARDDLPNAGTLDEHTTTETVNGCKQISTEIGPLESGGFYDLSLDFVWTDPTDDARGLSAGVSTGLKVA